MGINAQGTREFESLYGAWAKRTPGHVADLFTGFPGLWWIAGGWALEAFTGIAREHADIDPSVLRADLPQMRRHLADRCHVWTATSGALRPLLPGLEPDLPADQVLPPGCGQVWTRRSAAHPWEFDILLVPGSETEWMYRRDESLRMPTRDALWERDGITYLQPEIQLLYKAKGLRAKDQTDFENTLPHLDARRGRCQGG
ncbi:nucleotidyltransferase domain-containing protein [Ornithinimicrobium sp. Y1694]|uniref:nucleotidyltransferase domain-containing protein n=1 Tax=Ornithinimicrobium sp. Y1694 TaxID=3418590 RepID=UPI003CF8C154